MILIMGSSNRCALTKSFMTDFRGKGEDNTNSNRVGKPVSNDLECMCVVEWE